MAHRLKDQRKHRVWSYYNTSPGMLTETALTGDDYYFVFLTRGVPAQNTGALVEARSNGISALVQSGL